MKPSLLPLCLLALAACTSEKRELPAPGRSTDSAGEHSAQPTPAPNASTARPEDAQAPRPAAPPRSIEFPEVEGWKRESPTSSMRAAQYRLPAAEGDAKDAELVVFYFQGGAGGFDANLARWYGQFAQPDGRPSAEVARHSQTTIAGRPAREVELSGTYVAETTPGSGQRLNEPGWQMLAAHLEGAEGAWFFKLVGPAATVERWRSDYRRFLGGIRAGG